MSKGVFFTLDAVIGITILFVGTFMAYLAFVQEPVSQPTIAYAEDIIGILAKTRFKDIDERNIPTEVKLLINDGIIDKDKTALAQIGEFYYISLKGDQQKQADMYNNIALVIKATIGNTVPKVYGWDVKIGGKSLYTANQGPPKQNAKIRIITQQISFGTYKQRTPYGPYIVEVEVWG